MLRFGKKQLAILNSTYCYFSESAGIVRRPNVEENSGGSERISEESQIQKVINLESLYINDRILKKLPERKPLVRDFFVREVDKDQLAYPQVIQQKEYEEITKNLESLRTFFEDKAKKPCDEAVRDLTDELLADFRSRKVFGTTVNKRYGGLGYFASEAALASECDAIDVKFNEILSGHRIAGETIFDHGTDAQKNEHLIDISKGNTVASIIPHQIIGNEQITAVNSNSEWILNGKRSFVVKSRHSNLFLVSAESNATTKQKFTTFILDAKAPGLRMTEITDSFGCTGVPYVSVELENVRVSEDNVLSGIHEFRTAADRILHGSRIQSAVLKAIQCKKILNFLINYTRMSTLRNEKMKDMQLFKHLLAKAASDLYATESVLFKTIGMIDEFENPRVDVETAITALLAHESLKNTVDLALRFPNPLFLFDRHPLAEDIRNCVQLLLRGESPETLKTFVGTHGIEHCHNVKGLKVKSYRDGVLSKFNGSVSVMNVKRDMELGEYLHPSLKESADFLEDSITRLFTVTNMILYKHRENAVHQDDAVKALGEAAALCFGIYSSIARASRSYCIGLRFSTYETVMSYVVVTQYTERVLHSMLGMKKAVMSKESFREISNHVIDNKSGRIFSPVVRKKAAKLK